MNTADARKIIVDRWIQKAEEALASANLEMMHGHYAFSVNRLYYAAFYAVSALLAQSGQEYGRHSAVRASLHRDFVKTGRVPVRFGALYDRLFSDRQEADYQPLRQFGEDDVVALTAETAEFVELLRRNIRSEFTATQPDQ